MVAVLFHLRKVKSSGWGETVHIGPSSYYLHEKWDALAMEAEEIYLAKFHAE